MSDIKKLPKIWIILVSAGIFLAFGILMFVVKPKTAMSPKEDIIPEVAPSGSNDSSENPTDDSAKGKYVVSGQLVMSIKDASKGEFLCKDSIYLIADDGAKYVVKLKNSDGDFRTLSNSDLVNNRVKIYYDTDIKNQARCKALTCNCEQFIFANLIVNAN